MKSVATRCHILKLKCAKFVFGRVLGELTTLPRPPSRLGRGIPPPHSQPPRRLWRLGLGAFGAPFRWIGHPPL